MFYEWNQHPSEAFYCLNTPYPLKHHIFCVVGPYVLMIQHILFYYITIFLLPYYCTNECYFVVYTRDGYFVCTNLALGVSYQSYILCLYKMLDELVGQINF